MDQVLKNMNKSLQKCKINKNEHEEFECYRKEYMNCLKEYSTMNDKDGKMSFDCTVMLDNYVEICKSDK